MMKPFSTSPLRVLYLDHAPILGGAERVLFNVLGALDRDRFAPMVGTTAGAPWLQELEALGIETAAIPFGRLNQAGAAMPLNLAGAATAVARIVRQHRIAIIHSNTVRAHIVAALAALITRTPLVWTLHDNTLPRRAARLLAPIPQRVITVSSWLKDLYGPLGLAHKTSVIYNGLRSDAPLASASGLRAELGVPADAPFVVNVGRLVAGKAPHLYVQAAQIAARVMPAAFFALVGGPDQLEPGQDPAPYGELLAQAIRDAELAEHLIATGYRPDVARFYAAADVVAYSAVVPEGLPTVLLEAMQTGCCLRGGRRVRNCAGRGHGTLCAAR
jgi:glycosyltransferase involved in cell wall biosynthesis